MDSLSALQLASSPEGASRREQLGIAPRFWSLWFSACRPKTLAAGIVPVLIGTALSFDARQFQPLLTCCIFAFAILIQVTTNLANDYFDYKKGADGPDRLGPKRALQSGLIGTSAMRTATIGAFLLAALCGSYLVMQGGPVMLCIAIVSLLLSLGYTGGPFPLAYQGLGDLFVFIFFGLVATAATYYLQAGIFSYEALAAGCALGCLSTAMLVVNNIRDINSDRRARKLTMAVRFGIRFSEWEYVALLLLGPLVPLLWTFQTQRHYGLWATALVYLPAQRLIAALRAPEPDYNALLGKTGKLLVAYGVLYLFGLFVI